MATIAVFCPGYSRTFAHACGNVTTINRIRSHLEHYDFRCQVYDPEDIKHNGLSINWKKFKAVVAIHAFYCANILQECPLPFILVFGGTDINKYCENQTYFEKIDSTVSKARYVISLGKDATRKIHQLWPSVPFEKMKQISQAVITSPSNFKFSEFLKTSEGIKAHHIFLLIAGIRPVKDPLFLIHSFSAYHRLHNNDWLVIVGPKRDEKYYALVKDTIMRCQGVILLSELPQADIHAAIRDSTALINSSLSESSCSSILEAMDLETPVIARDIPGNRDIVENGKTGLLFSTPKEFLNALELLLESRELYERITRNAKLQVLSNHNPVKEAESYRNLLCSILEK